MKKAALVVITYNQPRFLSFNFESLRQQTYKNFEVFIADDGSRPQTKELIECFRESSGLKVHHFWHKDEGYRKSIIANRAFAGVLEADIPVTIHVDGDTVLQRRFIEDHVKQHQTSDNLLFMGRRVNLGPDLTESLTVDDITWLSKGFSKQLYRRTKGDHTENINRAARIGSKLLRRLTGRDKVADLLGSNFSISTALLEKINGYNEDYRGYWGEDGDLFVRARNAGAEIYGSKGIAIQFHLYHKQREPDPEVMRNYYEVLLKDYEYDYCTNGIKKAGING